MIWSIDRAPAVCDSVTAYYVNKTATQAGPIIPLCALHRGQRVAFAIVNNGSTGVSEIKYSVPSAGNINLALFNMKGALVQNLANGLREPGISYTIAVSKNISGNSVKPGAYVVKLATPESSEQGTIIIK